VTASIAVQNWSNFDCLVLEATDNDGILVINSKNIKFGYFEISSKRKEICN
jgi:hypothetical protein